MTTTTREVPAIRDGVLRELGEALPDRPFTVRLWTGSELPSTTGDGPRLRVHPPRGHRAPAAGAGPARRGRAYVSGGLEVDDLDAAMEMLDSWTPASIDRRRQARLAVEAARLAGLRPPRVPDAELRARGRRHTLRRDRQAVRHHYDLPPEFYALFLDASMTYSCGIFSRGARTLEEAQETKLELVCTKLGLRPGERVLDVGCGWGSFAIHAAARHGVRVVGITLSEPQAERARAGRRTAGVADRVEIRVMDYREITDGPFDAIASIGMVEHVGDAQIDAYASRLAALLPPGGRLLNHGIARLPGDAGEPGPFSDRYVFRTRCRCTSRACSGRWSKAGFVTNHVEGFAPDYERTLSHWIERLDANREQAERLAGTGAAAGVAALPPCRAQRLRQRLHLRVPGALRAGPAALARGRHGAAPRSRVSPSWACGC
jgi:cyclopropane-fatty-acyl-phospholipid synthase